MQRLNPPDPATYSDEQKRIADSVTKSRGSVRGPFGVWLHSPGLADPAQQVGAFLRYGSKMPGNLRELVIIAVGRHWGAQYEWYAHAKLAVEEGVSPEAVERLRRKQMPEPLTADELLVYGLTVEILTTGRLSVESYAAGTDRLGPEQMVELVGLCGYYSLISFTLNVFDVPVPEGDPPLGP
ncbi:MAG: carboxymuconolactone decarboxylase family protein [Rhodospirillaceae bacterium]